MRKLYLLAFVTTFFFLSQKLSAQDELLPKVVQLHKAKLSLLGLTYQWEKPISRKSIFSLEAGLAGGMSLGSDLYDDTELSYILAPAVGVGFRNYYNIDKRSRNGKNIINNSANFIAVDIVGNGPALLYSDNIYSEDFGLNLSAAWGMQRKLSGKFNFEWQAGVGGYTDFIDVTVSPVISVSFSYLLGKK